MYVQGVSVHGGVHRPVNRMTDRCKNIMFPQLRLRTVNIWENKVANNANVVNCVRL